MGKVQNQSHNLLMPHVSLVSNAPATCYTLPLVSLVYTLFPSNNFFYDFYNSYDIPILYNFCYLFTILFKRMFFYNFSNDFFHNFYTSSNDYLFTIFYNSSYFFTILFKRLFFLQFLKRYFYDFYVTDVG
jgi:hypothetical protein